VKKLEAKEAMMIKSTYKTKLCPELQRTSTVNTVNLNRQYSSTPKSIKDIADNPTKSSKKLPLKENIF
jgi:hypothetical protein